jgi:hypothetical protein
MICKITLFLTLSIFMLQVRANTSEFCAKNILTEKRLLDAKEEMDRIAKNLKTRIESKNLAQSEHLIAIEMLADVATLGIELQNQRYIMYLSSLRKIPGREGVVNLYVKFSIELLFTQFNTSEKVVRIHIPFIDDFEISRAAREYRDFLENFNRNSTLCR